MSFILDALKKSDGERQRQTGPVLFEIRSASRRGGLPIWAITLGALLLINLVALAWFVTRSPKPAPRNASAAGVATSPAPAPAPAPAAAAAIPTAASPTTASAPMNDAPVLPPEPLATAPMASPGYIDENPADYEEALPAGNASPPALAGREAAERNMVPTVDQLPASIGNQLPPLRLDLHVYATRAADRFVMINMQRLREGDATRDGVRVEEILPDGVVLSFRGTRFQLGRE